MPFVLSLLNSDSQALQTTVMNLHIYYKTFLTIRRNQRRTKPQKSTQKGMTLIEIVISIAILSTLALLTTQSIRTAVDNKRKMQSGMDQSYTLKNAMSVIERDINLAFNYHDPHAVVKKQLSQSSNPQNPNDPPPVNNLRPEEKLTHFLGAGDTINFTSTSNIGMKVDMQESDQMEVGYFLNTCKSFFKEASSNCLWRRTSPIIDEDIENGGNASVLIENVAEFKLRYIGLDYEDWVEEWRSDGKGFTQKTVGKFPDAVEVTLVTEKNKKQMNYVSVFAIRHPNNEGFESEESVTPPSSNNEDSGDEKNVPPPATKQ